jgi:hypothetical protein
MPTMTINRTANKLQVFRQRPGDIRLLEDVNARANRRVRLRRTPHRMCDVLRELEIGESVFLEGYTANHNDADPRLKYMRTQGYTQNNTRVLTVRSTEENGIKGVRVYREG